MGERIAIPIEQKNRELFGKIWLSLKLIEDGHIVYLGRSSGMKNSIDIIRPHFYLGYSTLDRQSKRELFRKLKASGSVVGILENEGGVFVSDEYFADKRCSDSILEFTDIYFAWGPRPAEILADKSNFSREQIYITGPPRFDLLRKELRNIYAPEADQIKSRYGDYILINTNFVKADSSGDSEAGQQNNEINRQALLREEFMELAVNLGKKFTKFEIIIRPHPNEDIQSYEHLQHKYRNITTINSLSVRPWISAAECVIHNGCTTGIEAVLMDTPAISYQPRSIQNLGIRRADLANDVSIKTTDIEGIENILNNLNISPNNIEQPSNTELSQYISTVNDYAVDQIKGAIGNVEYENLDMSKFSPSIERNIKRYLLKTFGVNRTEKLLERITMRDYSRAHRDFPGLNRRELENIIERFDDFIEYPVTNVEISRIEDAEYIFRLERK